MAQAFTVNEAAALIGLAGCSPDSPTTPAQLNSPAIRYSNEGGLTVLNAQLRAAGTSSTAASGHIQLKFLPPNPILPPNPVSVAIEGVIFNPDLETLSGVGGIFELTSVGSDGGQLAEFEIGIPSPPPIRYRFEGTVLISSDLATALYTSRGSYSITLGNLAGRFIPGGPPI